jgi:hypothetical protein
MRLVYEFIGEPWFEHDFEHLSYDAPDFDDALGVSRLHRVKPKVELQPRRTILPPDLFEQFAHMSFGVIRAGAINDHVKPMPRSVDRGFFRCGNQYSTVEQHVVEQR